MGFFSKESGSGTDRRNSTRSGEAEANELRVKARRRLVGALALVVAAVIVVPMLIDDDPPPGPPVSPIVVPAVPPLPDQNRVDLAAANSAGSITIEQLPEPEAPDTNPPASAPAAATAVTASAAIKPSSTAVPPPADTRPVNKPESVRVEPKGARTDDGSLALALLEGRKPETAAKPPAAASAGSFILQVAAYTTEQDAAARRGKLIEAGVTNAFVESTTVNGKKTWRLRVGPFPSREAAQAAQTRLRALGYGNGFIASK